MSTTAATKHVTYAQRRQIQARLVKSRHAFFKPLRLLPALSSCPRTLVGLPCSEDVTCWCASRLHVFGWQLVNQHDAHSVVWETTERTIDGPSLADVLLNVAVDGLDMRVGIQAPPGEQQRLILAFVPRPIAASRGGQ